MHTLGREHFFPGDNQLGRRMSRIVSCRVIMWISNVFAVVQRNRTEKPKKRAHFSDAIEFFSY